MEKSKYQTIDDIIKYINSYKVMHDHKHISKKYLADQFVDLICTSRYDIAKDLELWLKTANPSTELSLEVIQTIDSIYGLPSQWVGVFEFELTMGNKTETLEKQFRQLRNSNFDLQKDLSFRQFLNEYDEDEQRQVQEEIIMSCDSVVRTRETNGGLEMPPMEFEDIEDF